MGRVIRSSFVETTEDYPDSNSETGDEYNARCSVRFQGHPEPQ